MIKHDTDNSYKLVKLLWLLRLSSLVEDGVLHEDIRQWFTDRHVQYDTRHRRGNS